MTIAVALAVPDGIALAADTQTTWFRRVTHTIEAGTQRVIDLAYPISMPTAWSRIARKLFSVMLSDRIYAVAVSGEALLNNKTPYSIFKSLEVTYAGDGSFDSALAHFVEGIKDELRLQLGVTDLALAPTTMDLSFILGSREGGDVSRPILTVTNVYSGSPPAAVAAGNPGHFVVWQNSTQNPFNVCWTGVGEYVNHLVNHRNPELARIEFYPGMTLHDASDYAAFLAEFTCDFQRFASMVPSCGRPVIVATLTPEGFEIRPTRGS